MQEITTNRDAVLSINRRAVSGGLTEAEVANIISNYCIEQGKEPAGTSRFIDLIFRLNIFEPYFVESLEYYQKKFNIITIRSSPDSLGVAKIIYIY